MKLDAKVALVTGAASGIGHAIAKRYAAEGARVAIADLNLDAATAAAKELGDSKTAMAVAMDVSNEDQVNAGVEKVAAAFGTCCRFIVIIAWMTTSTLASLVWFR